MSSMPKTTVITGLLLIAAGLGGFAAAGFEGKAITALIPAAFGLLITISGIVAFREGVRKHAMHLAAMFASLGFVAGAGRLISAGTKGSIDWTLSTFMVVFMSVICLVLAIVCVKSFTVARRSRTT